MKELIKPGEGLVKDRIKERVRVLLEENASLFFSYLYRMDIPECDIKKCFGSHDPAEELAEIILRKQIYRLHNKKNTSVQLGPDNPDLKW